MEVAVWSKTSAKGTQYMSMSFSEPWVNPNAQAEAPKQDLPQDLPSNEMPF